MCEVEVRWSAIAELYVIGGLVPFAIAGSIYNYDLNSTI